MAEIQEWCHFPADQKTARKGLTGWVSLLSLLVLPHILRTLPHSQNSNGQLLSVCPEVSMTSTRNKVEPLCVWPLHREELLMVPSCSSLGSPRHQKTNPGLVITGPRLSWCLGSWNRAGRFLLNHSPKSIGSWYLFVEKTPVPRWQRPSSRYLFS